MHRNSSVVAICTKRITSHCDVMRRDAKFDIIATQAMVESRAIIFEWLMPKLVTDLLRMNLVISISGSIWFLCMLHLQPQLILYDFSLSISIGDAW